MVIGPKNEFDRFSENYRQLLDRSVRISGESGDYFAELKARYISSVVSPPFSGTVLDFGCGIGLLARMLRKYLPDAPLYGYDASPASIERIEPNLAAQAVFTPHKRELLDSYDLIVISNVMHHIPPADRQATILELVARLNPSGKLVLFEHNPANPLTRWVVSHCPFDRDAVLLWPAETRSYLTGASLQIVRKDYLVFFPRALSWLRSLEARLPWCPLGAQYAFVGTKRAAGE